MAASGCGESNKLKKLCKYCKNNVLTGPSCVKCNVPFHNSCAKRVKVCCDMPLIENTQPEHSDASLTEEAYLREENKLLKQIVTDKDTIINDKDSIISLLHDKITLLEEKLCRNNNKNDVFSLSSKQNPSVNEAKNALSKTCSVESTKDNLANERVNKNTNLLKDIPSEINRRDRSMELQVDSCIKSGEISKEIMKIQTLQKCEELINLVDSRPGTARLDGEQPHFSGENDAAVPSKEEKWNLVQKKNKHKKRAVGQADAENQNQKFKGQCPKVWMFLNRVNQDVNSEDIEEYLKTKIGNEGEFIVKKLRTSEGSRFTNFMVAADLKFKNYFYSPSFWPRGVGYKRFNFDLYYQKYGIRDVLEGNVEVDRPISFLDPLKHYK
ncbi:unnamed protein product [Phaedon cochleariae]|uniref:Phorbol-ester/DAG-type domain-containing protein n=1 Tax=Phaedon cochleariae TaxID=80249 RepID=A0A9N9SEK2_PHACE|nr:unnamed protein product [Phaedon cochleariae]